MSYKKLIQAASNILRPKGYEKKLDYFFKRICGNLGFVWFVKDKYPKENGKQCFTVSICGASQKLLDRFQGIYYFDHGRKANPYASPALNHFEIRLGYLMGYQTDYWWKISSETDEDDDKVIPEVLNGITTYGLPLLDASTSDEALCKEWLGAFDLGEFQNLLGLNGLIFLLKDSGDEENFQRVASYAWDKYGDRPFGTGNITQYLSELGFSPRPPET